MRTLVITSDNYRHALAGFAYLHNKHLGESQEASVLCFKAGPRLPQNFSKVQMGRQGDYTWSSALIKFLKRFNDTHWLILLEDYFITRADIDVIRRMEAYMREYAGIGKIDLSGDRLKPQHPHKPHGEWRGVSIVRSAHNAPYAMSMQAALWRTDFLLDYLNPEEDPWRAEKGMSLRFTHTAARGEEKRLILAPASVPMNGEVRTYTPDHGPLEYINAIGGAGSKPQVWDRRKFPREVWEELLALGYVEEEKEAAVEGGEEDGEENE
jgi:hypothetical protein